MRWPDSDMEWSATGGFRSQTPGVTFVVSCILPAPLLEESEKGPLVVNAKERLTKEGIIS